jgi:hypothetical protein
VTFTFRRDDHRQELVRLVDNRLALSEEHGGRLSLSLRGHRLRLRHARIPHGRWVRVRLVVSSGGRAVSLTIGRVRKLARRVSLRSERAVQIGRRCRTAGGPCRFASLRIASASISSPTAGGGARPFAATSVWNAPVGDHPELDAKSATYVSELAKDARANPWLNYDRYSTPVYTVPRTQARVRVISDAPYGPGLQQAWNSVPIPPDAHAAVGTDKHMVIWQPSTDTMWEFWLAARQIDGWHARWGGVINNVSRNPGRYERPHSDWGATASSLPLLGGLMRISELKSGHIDHALALAIPAARAEYFSWPAQRTDGYVHSENAIPEGAHFRLDPNLNIAGLNLPPLTRMIAEAAQRYGIVVRDQSGCVCFYGEDPTPTGRDPYAAPNGFFGQEKWVSNLLKAFPWERLQALKTEQHCCWKDQP